MKLLKLQDLMNEIAEKWPFDKEIYPDIPESPKSRKILYAVRHIFEHQVKAIGYLAQVIEPREHKDIIRDEFQIDSREMNMLIGATVKLFKNSLRLAQIIGIDADDLVSLSKH